MSVSTFQHVICRVTWLISFWCLGQKWNVCAVTAFPHCNGSLWLQFVYFWHEPCQCLRVKPFKCYRFCCFNGFRVIPVKNRSVVVQMCTSFVTVSVMMSFNWVVDKYSLRVRRGLFFHATGDISFVSFLSFVNMYMWWICHCFSFCTWSSLYFTGQPRWPSG